MKKRCRILSAFPPPLRGRAREGGRGLWRHLRNNRTTPNPSPQGGGEQACASREAR